MLAYLKFTSKIHASLQTMIRLLQLNLFARRELMALMRGDPPEPEPPDPQTQLVFV